MLINMDLGKALSSGLSREDIFVIDGDKMVKLSDLIGDKPILANFDSSKYDIHIEINQRDPDLEDWAKEEEDKVAAEIRRDEEMSKPPFIPPNKNSQKFKDNAEKERHEVIRLWNEGKSYDEIAEELKIKTYTVDKYMTRFSVIYGADVVSSRKIPYEVPLGEAS